MINYVQQPPLGGNLIRQADNPHRKEDEEAKYCVHFIENVKIYNKKVDVMQCDGQTYGRG